MSESAGWPCLWVLAFCAGRWRYIQFYIKPLAGFSYSEFKHKVFLWRAILMGLWQLFQQDLPGVRTLVERCLPSTQMFHHHPKWVCSEEVWEHCCWQIRINSTLCLRYCLGPQCCFSHTMRLSYNHCNLVCLIPKELLNVTCGINSSII